MSEYETSAERDARWEREKREESARAQKAFDAYQADKTKKAKIESHKADKARGWKAYKSYEYHDWTKETNKEVRTRTTTFDVYPDEVRMHVRNEKRQKFLVVCGPLAGTCQTDENDDYVLYNRNASYGKKTHPKCVLVHLDSLKDWGDFEQMGG
jgi:hypothetical protein